MKFVLGLIILILGFFVFFSGCVSYDKNTTFYDNTNNNLNTEFNVPTQLPDATVGQDYSYTFSNSVFIGDDTNSIKPEDINLQLENNILYGIPGDGAEGEHLIQICSYDSETLQCVFTKLYVMSDVVIKKGLGEIKTSMVWSTRVGKNNSGIVIDLKNALNTSSDPDYYKVISVYDFPTQGSSLSWEQEYQMIGGIELSHMSYIKAPLSSLKLENISHEAKLDPIGPTGGTNAIRNIDAKTIESNNSTTFDITFNANTSAPCGKASKEYPFVQF